MLNNRHLVLKVIGFILLILCIQSGSYKSYCLEQGPVVVVREMDLRFGPVRLPLNEKTKNELKDYIRSGGDKRNTGPAPFYLHKKKSYEQLLYFLSSKGLFRVSDIFTRKKELYQINPRVSKWFRGPVVSSIIDATEKRPLSEKSYGPLAVSDGHLWWIFYRNKMDQIVRLKLTIR
jgi:hypothetical protein